MYTCTIWMLIDNVMVFVDVVGVLSDQLIMAIREGNAAWNCKIRYITMYISDGPGEKGIWCHFWNSNRPTRQTETKIKYNILNIFLLPRPPFSLSP